MGSHLARFVFILLVFLPSLAIGLQCPKGYESRDTAKVNNWLPKKDLAVEMEIILACEVKDQVVLISLAPLVSPDKSIVWTMMELMIPEGVETKQASIPKQLPAVGEAFRDKDGLAIAFAASNPTTLLSVSWAVETGVVTMHWLARGDAAKQRSKADKLVRDFIRETRKTPPPLPKPTQTMEKVTKQGCPDGYAVPEPHTGGWVNLRLIAEQLEFPIDFRELCIARSTEDPKLFLSGVFNPGAANRIFDKLIDELNDRAEEKDLTWPADVEISEQILYANRGTKTMLYFNKEKDLWEVVFWRVTNGGLATGVYRTRSSDPKEANRILDHWHAMYPTVFESKTDLSDEPFKPKTSEDVAEEESDDKDESPINPWWFIGGAVFLLVAVVAFVRTSNKRSRHTIDF